MPITYDKNSIVDTLKSQGQDSSLSARTALGAKYGIDYTKTKDNYATENQALLAKLNAGKVNTITSTTGYADSDTKAGDYSTASDFVNKRNGIDGTLNPDGTPKTDTTKTDTTKTDTTKKDGGTPTVDSLTEEQNKKWADQARADTQDLYKSKLALVDKNYASKVASIGSSYETRINTLQKLNDLQLKRTKAYGMNSAQYMPLEYTDVVTTQEKNDANEVSAMERERDSLLAEAEYNRDQGKVLALEDNQKAIQALEDRLSKKVTDALDLIDSQNKLAEEKLKNEQDKALKEMKERALVAFQKYGDEYNSADTIAEKTKVIQKAMKDYSTNPADVTEQSVFGQQFNTATKDYLSIKNTESTIAKRNSGGSGGAGYTSTELKKLRQAGINSSNIEEADNYLYGGDGGTKTQKMENDISDAVLTFRDRVKTKGWKGIDPTEYKTLITNLKADYGASAVLKLEKALDDAGIEVDYGE